MKNTVGARIPINAGARNVFGVLKNFDHYHLWNPCISIQGNAIEGEYIKIKPRRITFWTSCKHQIEKIHGEELIIWKEINRIGFIIHTRREHMVYTKSNGSAIYSTKLYLFGFLAPIAGYFYGNTLYKKLREEAVALKRFCETHHPLTQSVATEVSTLKTHTATTRSKNP